MTAERAGAGDVPPSAGGASTPPPTDGAPPADAILDLCDGLLGEIGRRMHRFAWLKAPGEGSDAYLPIDSYFPGNRIVVICREQTSEEEQLCREEVPAHGLHLLKLEPAELGHDPAEITRRLIESIEALGELAARPQERLRPEPGAPPARPQDRARPEPGAPPASAPATSSPSRHSRPPASGLDWTAARTYGRHERERSGLLLGVTLAVVLVAEILGLVVVVGFAGGRPVLAIGFAFDVCARALGTIAGVREGSTDLAWGCLILGSPAVVNYALLGEETVRTEPAPLAGALGALAIALVVLALLGSLLGI